MGTGCSWSPKSGEFILLTAFTAFRNRKRGYTEKVIYKRAFMSMQDSTMYAALRIEVMYLLKKKVKTTCLYAVLWCITFLKTNIFSYSSVIHKQYQS